MDDENINSENIIKFKTGYSYYIRGPKVELNSNYILSPAFMKQSGNEIKVYMACLALIEVLRPEMPTQDDIERTTGLSGEEFEEAMDSTGLKDMLYKHKNPD